MQVGFQRMTINNVADDIQAMIKAGHPADAAQAAYQAATTGRADPQVLALGGAAAYQAGVDGLALELFSRLDARAGMDAPQWAMMGHAAERLGVNRVAIPAYRRSLELQPQSPPVHYNLGSIHLRRHQWSEAIAHLKAACDGKPDWQAAWENLAQAMLGTEHYEAIVPFLEDCMKRFPDNAYFHVKRAEALMSMGDHDGAEAAFRWLTEQLPDVAEIWGGLAAAVIQDVWNRGPGFAHLDVPGLDLGDIQQIVDQIEHMSAGRSNIGQVFPVLGIAQFAIRFLADKIGETDHRVQRRPRAAANLRNPRLHPHQHPHAQRQIRPEQRHGPVPPPNQRRVRHDLATRRREHVPDALRQRVLLEPVRKALGPTESGHRRSTTVSRDS